MSTIRVNSIQHTTANGGNMILHANGNVSMVTANSTLFIGNTSISNAGISVSGSAVSPFGGMRNRIINGAMVIDQRNSGANSTSVNVYTIDRFYFGASQSSKGTWGQNLNSVTPPAGFSKYLGWQTASSSYSVGAGEVFNFYQTIEGNNFHDLSFGTSSAKTVTLSFWVRCSLTGTFGGSLVNYASNRCYPFSYTINLANTWEYKTITIPGDTSGTWAGATTSGAAILLLGFGCGATYSGTPGAWTSSTVYNASGTTSVLGTANATWYITGVQLEEGPGATPFEFRQYGTELALCQRYYFQFGGSNVYDTPGMVTFWSSTYAYSGGSLTYPVPMRATPTMTTSSGSHWYVNSQGYSPVCTAVNAYSATPTNTGFQCIFASGGGPGGYCGFLQANNNLSARLYFSADI